MKRIYTRVYTAFTIQLLKQSAAVLTPAFFVTMTLVAMLPVKLSAQALTLGYASPQTYAAGTTITPLSPTGSGAAAPAYSSTTTTLGSGFNIPAGVAVDAAGNIYIGDQNNNVVKKIPGGTGTPVVIASGFNTPDGVAIDAQGNVYVADDGNNLVKEVPYNNGTYGSPVAIGTGFLQPFNVAVDSKGNVYVADRGNNAVKEIPVGGGATFAIGSGFVTPTGVAVDAYGNVYVADFGNSAIKEIPVGGGAPVTLGSGFSTPFGVAVDGSGNVFVTDYGNKQVKEIAVNGGAITTVGSGYSFIFGVAVDQYNNVYVTDYGNNAVKKIQPTGGYYINPALPAGLSFNNTTGAISGTPVKGSPATNYTVTAYNGLGSNAAVVNITVCAVCVAESCAERAIPSSITGTNYQWQLSTDSVNFNNINNNSIYSGTNTDTLHLSNAPSSWYGYQYRCVVDGNYSSIFTLRFTDYWTGAVNSAWENPGNWACGTLPDANTDVIINSGTAIVNSNVTIRSLSLAPSVNLTVHSGFKLTVNH